MSHMVITIDVEDWYQVENFKKCIPVSSWPSCESRVEKNTHLLLDLLDSQFQPQHQQSGKLNESSGSKARKATFFVLGWLAKRMPRLVREIHARGHEVASHGYHHKLASQCSSKELRQDLLKSRLLLEEITGAAIHGYRAPSFSIDDSILKTVEDCGYLYDSSFNSFATNRRYGNIALSPDARHGIAYRIGEAFWELPVSNLEIAGHVVPLAGGGYFRVIPLKLFIFGVKTILRKQNAYLFYLHPWEIDPEQPRVKEASRPLRARHYVNLKTTMGKLFAFLERFTECCFATCSQYIESISLNAHNNSGINQRNQ